MLEVSHAINALDVDGLLDFMSGSSSFTRNYLLRTQLSFIREFESRGFARMHGKGAKRLVEGSIIRPMRSLHIWCRHR